MNVKKYKPNKNINKNITKIISLTKTFLNTNNNCLQKQQLSLNKSIDYQHKTSTNYRNTTNNNSQNSSSSNSFIDSSRQQNRNHGQPQHQRTQRSYNDNRRRTFNTTNDDLSMESNEETPMNNNYDQQRRNTDRRRKPQTSAYGNRSRNEPKNQRKQSNNDRKSSYVRGMKKPMTITIAKQKIKQLKQEKQELELDKNSLNEELDDLNNEISNAERDYKQEITNLKNEISGLQNIKFQMQNSLQMNEQKINSFQNEVQMKNNQMQMNKNSLNSAQQQIQSLQQNMQMKNTSIVNHKNDIQILQSQNAMHIQTTQQQMKQLNQQTLDINENKSKLDLLSKELQHEKSEKLSLELKNITMGQKCERQLREINEMRNNELSLKRTLEMSNNSMSQMRIEMSAVKSTKIALENTCESQASVIVKYKQMIDEQNDVINDCKLRSLKDEELRKYLHNKIQELKGNIRVFCRVRPLLTNENQIQMNMDIDGNTNENIYSVFSFKDEDIENKEICLVTPSVVNRMGQLADGKRYNFTFDRIFRPHALQNEIFDEISQLVQSALDGYKGTHNTHTQHTAYSIQHTTCTVCIFAYGQTGSGKTYTMEGPSTDENDDRRGMIPRAVEKIFEHANKLSSKGWQFKCTATYLEIYNEKIRDLLKSKKNTNFNTLISTSSSNIFSNMNNSSNSLMNQSVVSYNTMNSMNSSCLSVRRNSSFISSSNSMISSTSVTSADTEYLELHQRKSLRNKNKIEVYVDGLSEHVVQCPADVYPLLKLAKKHRSIGQTKCNVNSSRSHSIFQLYLNGFNANSNQHTYGILNLIDLAGSERLKKSESTGSTLKETININQSLSCLMDVISALSKKNSRHIPYRNSKLTHLLMNYFGNQSKTLMFINLCPESNRCSESLCSLRFAAKVNDCQIGIAKRNV